MAHLVSPTEEAQVFWRLRRRLLANRFRQALSRARLRVALVVFLSAVFWGALYFLCEQGFDFLRSALGNWESLDQFVGRMLGLFFFSLLIMLVFSTGIIIYGSLYRSREADFLLTLPVRPQRLFAFKFLEALLFSSWGFVLMGSPLLVAYGQAAGAPWHFYAMLVPFMAAFACIPGAAGAACCLAIVRWLPATRFRFLFVAGLLALAGAGWLGWTAIRGASDPLTPAWFEELTGRLEFSQYQLLPSWWLSAGLLEAARGEWSQGVLFLTLLLSNALVAHQGAGWLAGRIYRTGHSELHGDRVARKPARSFWADRWLARATFFLRREMRLLLVKDLRLFRRDPVQWSQFLIFFGLLGLYFLNVRRLSYDSNSATWVNMVSFLNLAVVGLILSTFTTRFIFPMISLEGRRFWVLGLLPIDRGLVLWGKFLFSSIGSLTACTVLILLSDCMLRVSHLVIAVHVLCCTLLCVGLSGIAVGLGALMPDLREESPSKIAAGFGGTLNLVLSTIYILAIVFLTAVPCHFYLANNGVGQVAGLFNSDRLLRWLLLGTAASVGLGILATVLPLKLGFKAFRELEF